MEQAFFQRLRKLAERGERVVVVSEHSGEPLVLLTLADYEALRAERPAKPQNAPAVWATTEEGPVSLTKEDEEELWDADVIFANIQKERNQHIEKKPIPARNMERTDAESAFFFQG